MRMHSLVAWATFAALVPLSCSDSGFGRVRNPPRLEIDLASQNTGSREAPLPLQVGVPAVFKVRVRALTAEGAIDTSFNRYVRLSARPGAVGSLSGPGVDGRNVLVTNGESVEVDVGLTNTYGTAYIVADDLGYVPADPLRNPPPACANGVNDDDDEAVDFPADPGCAFANDDSEEAGTYSEGTSPPIFFHLPRIADVRGIRCEPQIGCLGNGRTPYPREPILIDTGWRSNNTYAFDTVVTRISSDGFYATDVGDTRAAFNSIFAFNFNAPPRMRVCDRLNTWGGTANEFFGFTQISYPTWTLEEWDPRARLCLVPRPEALGYTELAGVGIDSTDFLKRSAGLVRVETLDFRRTTMVTPKFGPGFMPCLAGDKVVTDPSLCSKEETNGRYKFVPDPLLRAQSGGDTICNIDPSNPSLTKDCIHKYETATSCDFDRNGKINSFAAGDIEGDCSTACAADPACTEYSNYDARKTFRLTVTERTNESDTGRSSAIQVDASASAGFDPLQMRGKPIRSFTGTLAFFSGGTQFTIEARCKDDIVLDMVLGPFPDDLPCTTDKECADRGLPKEYACRELASPGSPKGCRKVNATNSEVLDPPPLACVFPRTSLDNNPQ